MGKKGKWYVAVTKIFSLKSKKIKSQKSKKKWGLGKCMRSNSCISEPSQETTAAATPPPDVLPQLPLPQEGDQQSNHALSVARASAVAAEAAVVAAQAAAEVVRLTTARRFSNREKIAAIKIQTAFRGYSARKALQCLRGMVRLKSLMESNAIKRQTANTLYSMQSMARVQSQVRLRRIRMSEQNQALQRQLQLKHERELEKLKVGEEWDDSLHSKQQIEAKILHKQEAAMRRERTLAYAFSHQWRNSSRSVNLMFMDPTNPHWGWSWLERWMAARPWENRSTTEREVNSDHTSVKSSSWNVRGEIIKAHARRKTPPPKAPSVVGKGKSASPKGVPLEDDMRSTHSFHSERPRRHSLAGSSVRDDESLASSPAVPSYMAPTESAKLKSRPQSPLNDKIGTPERKSMSSVKKKLSFPAEEKNGVPSPARARRHSGPPKLDAASPKEVAVHSAHNASNGGNR